MQIAVLRRATTPFVSFPVGFLALTAAIPLVLAFGAAFQRDVCWTSLAFCTGLLRGTHGRESVNRQRQVNNEFV